MDYFTSLFDAIDQFEDILYDIDYTLKESILWRKIFKQSLKENDNIKSILNFDAKQLLRRANEYRTKLRYYRQNYTYFDETSSIQERDVKLTTDKFFTEVVQPVRDKAISSLKQLSRMISNTKAENEKNILIEVRAILIQATNELIDACIRVIEINKSSLIRGLERKGINFKEKYCLEHISIDDV